MRRIHKILGRKFLGLPICLAKTDAGNDVEVWQGSPGPRAMAGIEVPAIHRAPTRLSEDYTHFCHGYSLGTYKLYGYSVFSRYVDQVLDDEYRCIGRRTIFRAMAGDIVVWRESGEVAHSAKIESVEGTAPTELTTRMGSKDTFSGISHKNLIAYCVVWGDDWALFRRKFAPRGIQESGGRSPRDPPGRVFA